jgi:hypothetical protein
LEKLKQLGTEVVVEALDVGDEDGLRSLLQKLRVTGPPLRGVWHSAGVLADAMLSQQNEDLYALTLSPKVVGSVLLDALTRADPLDSFVLFSSAASVLGARGQSNHAAANAFLDGLAHYRADRGLPALSINWGPWSEVGAAADRQITARLAEQGIEAVTPQQGLHAMHELLGRDEPQAAVLPVDWGLHVARNDSRGFEKFLSNVVVGASTVAKPIGSSTSGTTGLQEKLAEEPVGRRRPLVANFVREQAIRVLGIDQRKAVDPRVPLGELGLDSLLAVELRNVLSRAIGQALPASLLFDYPTLDDLTDHLLKLLEVAEVVQITTSTDDRTVTLVGSIEELSDAEVDRLLELRAQRG